MLLNTTNTLENCGKAKNKEETKMRKIILSQQGCSKCKTLADQCPDAEVIMPQPAELLSLARMLNIQSLPIVVLTGEPQELATIL